MISTVLNIRRGLQVVAFSLCCAVVFCLSACSGPATDSVADQDSGSLSSDEAGLGLQKTGGKLASSIPDYASKFLKDYEPSDFQRRLLEKVVREGSLSTGDYENAWGLFKRCFVEKGHGNIVFTKTTTGVYNQSYLIPPGENDNSDKITKDFRVCLEEYFSYVSPIYEAQIGNPNLYSNPEEGALDCLHRAGVLPKNYGLEQFTKDRKDQSQKRFDVFSPPFQDCLVPNGIYMYDVRKM